MDSERLTNLLQNTYIPPQKEKIQTTVPSYHPCLVLDDSRTDIDQMKECGCSGKYCVKNATAWIPKARR